MITSGTIGNGGKIPIPTGYKPEECIFIVSAHYELGGDSYGGHSGYSKWQSTYCSVNDNGVVTAYSQSPGADFRPFTNSTVNYWVIAIKGYNKYKV